MVAKATDGKKWKDELPFVMFLYLDFGRQFFVIISINVKTE